MSRSCSSVPTVIFQNKQTAEHFGGESQAAKIAPTARSRTCRFDASLRAAPVLRVGPETRHGIKVCGHRLGRLGCGDANELLEPPRRLPLVRKQCPPAPARNLAASFPGAWDELVKERVQQVSPSWRPSDMKETTLATHGTTPRVNKSRFVTALSRGA